MKKLGIVFALDAEKNGLNRVLAESRSLSIKGAAREQWTVGNMQFLVEVSGMGRERCEAATQTLIENGAGCIIAAGFATALDDSIKPGDVIIADRVLLYDGRPADPIESDYSMLSAVPPSGWVDFSVTHGDLVTADTIVRTVEDKNRIYLATGAAGLDMESFAAAQVCQSRDVPFIAIRGISDSAQQELPTEIETLAAMNSMFSQLMYLLVRPYLWMDIVKLRKQSTAAANNLADVLGMIILRII